MVGLTTWLRYFASKLEYSVSLSRQTYGQGRIADNEILDTIWRTFLQGRLTFLHCHKGEDTTPMSGMLSGTLLVRKIPAADPRRVHVGDVVVLKDPANSKHYLVRRLAAVEGHEMVSENVNDEPFVLEKGQCWVVSDNKRLKPKEAYDSRTFGPVTMTCIEGRVIYCLRNPMDHGPVHNSISSTRQDSAVLEMELDVDEMAKNQKP